MNTLPKNMQTMLEYFSSNFTKPTFQRFSLLVLAAILTTGSRTISNLLRTVELFAWGHASSFHRVFSKRRWSMWLLARGLLSFIFDYFCKGEIVFLAGDDTVEERRGRKVYGKGKHRDAIRSTRSLVAYVWGHKWVVLSVLIKFPFASRPWALPVLIALYRAPAESRREGLKHKTPVDLMQSLICILMRWFPQKKFVFAGDGSFGCHQLAVLARQHRDRLTLVSRFYEGASLYSLPDNGKRVGRPRVKGAKQFSPGEVVRRTRRKKINVSWYGGERRDIEIVTDTGHWYKSGAGLVEVRWVFVHDLTGTHRDEYFFTTDVKLSPKEIVEIYTGRWSLEVTFEELRAYVGLKTERGWTKQTVLRYAPCIFGLFSVITLLFAQLPAGRRQIQIFWPGKEDVTFSDAIVCVRRWLWKEWIFKSLDQRRGFAKLSRQVKQILLYNLAPAA